MTAQDALYIVLMAVFFLVAWAMLTGGTGDSGPALVHGRHRAGRPGLAVVPGLEPDDVLPFVSGPDYRDEPDDWTADLPTAVIPAVKPQFIVPAHAIPVRREWLDKVRADLPRRTSPSETAAETARRRWGVETPIFAGLAKDWGYDPIYGLDQAIAVA
ncbi:hypothetical protein [Mycolicibacter arupensis]|jgi:hypothetical protein|uniref:Uncharacterized protein n=1 Tax=Mycolicibacter arupensis TaxID=342002 RepID=A0A0F5MZJ1_9MYCO|nr:hypothetical protein [Mycolicibacter arupensis]KKB99447.1 hypothetical protein WR43_09495 [Mycolicibacter arupensis]MCV7277050.1 hypothetical protein [Mycolicibacter arupensis]OQZ91330.1 hypothetical protein BST15_20035 [Mycolicibacter arupensis]TXI50245.1 MAG: hypothetical protein E6Q54_21590 [Mycolicibacter arupensis]